jgi:protein-tyrosine kinase
VLDVVTVGKGNVSDLTQPLFNSERMSTFISSVREDYDYVLIDTSAVLEAPETPIIGSYATGTVMVVRSGKTRREVIKRAMLMIEKLGGRFIGTVLNRKKYYIPEFIYRRV